MNASLQCLSIPLVCLFLITACSAGIPERTVLQNSPEEQPVNINLSDGTDSLQIFTEGTISTRLNERDRAISPEGTELFYSIFSYDNTVRMLMHCRLEKDQWSKPAPANFAGEYFDLEPAFSTDGNRLSFVSNRPPNPLARQ